MLRGGRADADLTIFDSARVIARATFEQPMIPSSGIVQVLVAGTFVAREARPVDGVHPGRPIGRSVASHE